MENKNLGLKSIADFLHSPFKYPGTKTYALEDLLPLIPKHHIYIEPFCGGASVFFGKVKVEENWLNDIDKELIETYKIIKDQPEKLIAFLKNEEESEERYNYFKTGLVPKDSYDIVARWFYLNMTSCSETMSVFWRRKDGFSLRPPGWQERILDCSEKLQSVKLTSNDFEDVISEAPEGAFLFIDPPYSLHHSSAQNKLHKYPFEKEAHIRLVDILKRNTKKIKFMLTYNENDEIREMYSWNNLVVVHLPNKPPQKEEIIIMNYEM